MANEPTAPVRRAPVRALLDLLTLGAVAPTAGTEQACADRLARAGVDALGADGAVVVVLDDAGAPLLWTASDDAARPLGDAEAHAGTGPALDCARTASPLTVDLAPGLGFVRAHAVPLRLADRAVGALVLLAATGRSAADDDQPWTDLLVAAAAGAILQQRTLRDLQRRADQLQTALTSRIVIEQAKGVLAERGGLDVQTAFDRMRRYARAHRLRLSDVAEEVVSGAAADAVLTHVRPLHGRPSILEP